MNKETAKTWATAAVNKMWAFCVCIAARQLILETSNINRRIILSAFIEKKIYSVTRCVTDTTTYCHLWPWGRLGL